MTAAPETRAPDEAARLRHRADFSRPLACILGLPFDLVDVAQAVRRIRAAAFGGERCFVSTPNLNFAMNARNDPAFRGSVLRSDLSLVDGMPLVWIGRLMGLPLRERVSGADVFEALQAHDGPAIKVYLFGGPPGAAELACKAINRRGGGVHCVGFDPAGFDGIESMSGDDRIERINRSGASFVLVSLGAGKGQAWIERNAARLTAPVLSHLGAVVNFAAGTVGRAPRWMQSWGLEWLWRIKEEPALWRRYLADGLGVTGLLLTRVLPHAVEKRWRDAFGHGGASSARLEVSCTPAACTLRLVGDWRAGAGLEGLRAALADCAAGSARLTVDLSQASDLGSAATALLLVARGWFEGRGGIEITGVSAGVAASLHRLLAADALLESGR
jgi:N-acetylglucosaminyldiphosphoundecaprenol N-acetyl-beta-D-mannosaminyltransferase